MRTIFSSLCALLTLSCSNGDPPVVVRYLDESEYVRNDWCYGLTSDSQGKLTSAWARNGPGTTTLTLLTHGIDGLNDEVVSVDVFTTVGSTQHMELSKIPRTGASVVIETALLASSRKSFPPRELNRQAYIFDVNLYRRFLYHVDTEADRVWYCRASDESSVICKSHGSRLVSVLRRTDRESVTEVDLTDSVWTIAEAKYGLLILKVVREDSAYSLRITLANDTSLSEIPIRFDVPFRVDRLSAISYGDSGENIFLTLHGDKRFVAKVRLPSRREPEVEPTLSFREFPESMSRILNVVPRVVKKLKRANDSGILDLKADRWWRFSAEFKPANELSTR